MVMDMFEFRSTAHRLATLRLSFDVRAAAMINVLHLGAFVAVNMFGVLHCIIAAHSSH